MESSMLKRIIIWKMEVTCESKMDFILIWKEDSKSQAQVSMLTEFKDVDNLKILIEEVRLDQDITTQVLCMSFYVNLSIRRSTIKGDATSVVWYYQKCL